MLTAGGQLTITELDLQKGGEGKKQASSKQQIEKPTPEQNRCWTTELIS
jgi:hypothetical protein